MATTDPEEVGTWWLRTRARARDGQVLQIEASYTEDVLLYSGGLTEQKTRAQFERQVLQTLHFIAKNRNLVLEDISLIWEEGPPTKVIRVPQR